MISVSVLGKSKYLGSGLQTAQLLLLLRLKAQVHFLQGPAGRFWFSIKMKINAAGLLVREGRLYRPCSALDVRGVSLGPTEETHREAEADNDAEHTEYQSWSWKYFKLFVDSFGVLRAFYSIYYLFRFSGG